MTRSLSTLEYALLGLIGDEAQSGYAIRKLFQETPLIVYSDSPGSIYPALRRLERLGLIRGTVETGGRQRRVLRLTAGGRRQIDAWLDAPVREADLTVGDGALELKLSFMSDARPRRLKSFLREWAALSRSQAAQLAAADRALTPKLSRSARMALRLGMSVVRARTRYLSNL